jgi:DNA-binding CsgD family transcriptional regulator
MASMACLAELVKNIKIPALVLDSNHKVVLTNSIETRVCDLSGTCIGKSLPDLFPGSQAGDLHDACLKTLELREPGTHHLQLESPDGFIDLTARVIPVFNVESMSWNLILTLEKKLDAEGNLGAVKPGMEDRLELNEAKANGAGETQEFRAVLRHLLREAATQLTELKEDLSAKLPHEIVLLVEALKKTRLSKEQRTYVELLQSNTRKLTEPFARRIASPMYKLSPKEVRVASLIKDGLTNKEIAKLLKLSKSTVLTHRHHVRAKLGLKNKKQNLQSYLNSFGT